jgi:hypothetical protein
VLGISGDTPFSHAEFHRRHALPFPLLSDVHRTVIKAYGVWDEERVSRRRDRDAGCWCRRRPAATRSGEIRRSSHPAAPRGAECELSPATTLVRAVQLPSVTERAATHPTGRRAARLPICSARAVGGGRNVTYRYRL